MEEMVGLLGSFSLSTTEPREFLPDITGLNFSPKVMGAFCWEDLAKEKEVDEWRLFWLVFVVFVVVWDPEPALRRASALRRDW